MTSQEFEKEFLRVPALQEQDQDIAGPHAICSQAPFPRVGGDEYCGKDVYETIWDHGPIGQKKAVDPYPSPTSIWYGPGKRGISFLPHFGCILQFSFRRILQKAI